MKRICYCLLLLLLPYSLLSQELKTFNDTCCAFTAKYPATWVNKIKEGPRVFFTSPAENENDNFFENVNISMTKNPLFGTQLKIKEFIPVMLEKLTTEIDDFEKLTERYFVWNNDEACEVIYTGKVKNKDTQVKITQWFCFSDGRFFLATYTALASNTVNSGPASKILHSIIFR